MEIITAMSYALQRPITVISGLEASLVFRKLTYNPLDIEREPIYIGHVKTLKSLPTPNHFIAFLLDENFVERAVSLEGSGQIDLRHYDDNVKKLDSYKSDHDVEMLDFYESDESL